MLNKLKAGLNEWTGVLALITLFVTGMLRLESRIDRIDSKFDAKFDMIAKEFQDFHGRLERQDAEYKAHMMYWHRDEIYVEH